MNGSMMLKKQSIFNKKIVMMLFFIIFSGIILTAAELVNENIVKGDYSLLDMSSKKSFATSYTQVYGKSKVFGKTNWRDGMVGGNGVNGFITSGSPYSDTLVYQNIDFIMPTGRNRDDIADLTQELEAARQAIINFNDEWLPRETEWDYSYTYHPSHQLRLGMKQRLYKNYIRWTDYETGEVAVQFTDKNGTWTRKTFTSREDNVTISSITQSDKGSKVNMTISIDDPSYMPGFGKGDEENMQYKRIVPDDCSYIALAAHYPDYEGSNLKNGGYAGVTYIVTIGGSKERTTLKNSKSNQNAGNNPGIEIKNAEAVYLITVSGRTGDMGKFADFKNAGGYALVDELALRCETVAEKYGGKNFEYRNALQPSADKHGALFNAVSFRLGNADDPKKLLANEALIKAQKRSKTLYDATVERAYNQGRYAMICCAGATMSRLSGMWTGEWNTVWRNIYTMNANVNLQSSGMNTANIMDFGVGYINFIMRQAEDWKINAAKIYGMKDAILVPVNTDGDRALNSEYNLSYPFQYWNAGASWMIQPVFEFWLCYGDMPVATDAGVLQLEKEILLPLLTLQSNFWSQLCTPEYFTDSNGNARYEKGKTELNDGEKYLIIPSYSPENTTGGNYKSTLAANASMDISAARDGLRMTVEIEKQTKTEGWETRVSELEKLLSLLPDYQYDSSGALCEWSANGYDDNNEHRHISHLYCAWPAFETQGNEKLSAACIQAIINRNNQNKGKDDTAAHGWMHKALVFARLKDGKNLYDMLYTIAHSRIYYDSMMTDHNAYRSGFRSHKVYCTDTSFGTVGVINEALLYSNTGYIEVLPALPKEWKTGSISGLVARTQAEVSINWGDNKVIVTVTSKKDQTITISYNNHTATVNFAEGETQTFTFN